MKNNELLTKVNSENGLTVEEVINYEKNYKPVKQVYGKYGNLAKDYIENHAKWKLITLSGDLPRYLHNVDKMANELYDTMYKKMSEKEEYKRTGNFMEDARKINKIKSIIHEEILNQIVYVK